MVCSIAVFKYGLVKKRCVHKISKRNFRILLPPFLYNVWRVRGTSRRPLCQGILEIYIIILMKYSPLLFYYYVISPYKVSQENAQNIIYSIIYTHHKRIAYDTRISTFSLKNRSQNSREILKWNNKSLIIITSSGIVAYFAG